MCEDRRAKVVVWDRKVPRVILENWESLEVWGFEERLACRESQDYEEQQVEKVKQALRVILEFLERKELEEDMENQGNLVYPVLRE